VGDDMDPDGDGLSNLMEFLMGGNPKAKEPARQPQPAYGIAPSDQHRYLTLTFHMAKDLVAGTLAVEGSTDLRNWSPTAIQLTPTGAQDATSIEYEAAIQSDGKRKQFLRLVGTRNPGQ